MTALYYTPPSNKVFKEVKEKSIELWVEIENNNNYLKEKVDLISSLQNVSDNMMSIFGMFDIINQIKLMSKLKSKTWQEIINRLKSVSDERF